MKGYLLKTIKLFVIPFVVVLLFFVHFNSVQAAAITSLTSGNFSATAWPDTTRSGTITSDSTTTSIVGSGTAFTTQVSVGNIIKTSVSVAICTVSVVVNDTHITCTGNSASTNSGIAYKVQGVGSGDTITIASGSSLTMDVASQTISSLTFAAVAASSTITISGSDSLTVTGLISMPRPSASQNCTIAVGAGSLTGGSLTMSATTPTSSAREDIISLSTGTVTISGTYTMTGTTADIISFTSSGLLKFGGTMTGGPFALTASTGTVEYTPLA